MNTHHRNPPPEWVAPCENPNKSPLRHDVATDALTLDGNALRRIVLEALEAVHKTVHKCLAAGQAMNEAKARLVQPRGRNGHYLSTDEDGFLDWLRRTVPEIAPRTAQRWMAAAANVVRALPKPDGERLKFNEQPYFDIEGIPISDVLSRPAEELAAVAREWRQTWFDFTTGKTIKACMAGLFLDGDEESERRAKNAINGKTSVRAGGGGDRKDYPYFTVRKLQNLNTFFAHWRTMSEHQRTEIKGMFAAAIAGHEYKLKGRPDLPVGLLIDFAAWPRDLCLVIKETVAERLRRHADEA